MTGRCLQALQRLRDSDAERARVELGTTATAAVAARSAAASCEEQLRDARGALAAGTTACGVSGVEPGILAAWGAVAAARIHVAERASRAARERLAAALRHVEGARERFARAERSREIVARARCAREAERSRIRAAAHERELDDRRHSPPTDGCGK